MLVNLVELGTNIKIHESSLSICNEDLTAMLVQSIFGLSMV